MSEEVNDPCMIPPEGWYCTRGDGHTGPCAAVPIEPPYEGELTRADLDRIDRAWETHKAASPTPSSGAGADVEGIAKALCFWDGPDGCGCVGHCQREMEPTNIWIEAAQVALAALASSPTEQMLREALEPFAKAGAIRLCGEWSGDKSIQGTDTAFHVTFGDLRHALKVYEQTGQALERNQS